MWFLIGILEALLIGAKMIGYSSLSWLVTFSPLLIGVCIQLFVFIGVIGFFGWLTKGR
jgi:hypothetical protein